MSPAKAAAAREKRQDIAIIARAHYDDEVIYLTEHGADKVIMGEREIAKSMTNILAAESSAPQAV